MTDAKGREGRGRVLRYAVATRETLERLLREPLAGVGTGRAPVRSFWREVFYDTPAGELEERGVTACLRFAESGERVLEVRVEPPPGAPAQKARVERLAADAGEPEELLAGLSAPAHLLRALVDPARLEPRLELETVRTVRPAAPGGAPGPELAGDAIVLRADGREVRLWELEARIPPEADEGEVAELLRELVEDYGLRPTLVPSLARARERLARGALDELEGRVRSARRVAVLAAHDGCVALRRDGERLRVPAHRGRGEGAALRVLHEWFGRGAGRVRLLGRSPAPAVGAALEVWMADGVGPADVDEAHEGELLWVPADALLSAVGSPALRDADTLGALHVLARHPGAAEPAEAPPPSAEVLAALAGGDVEGEALTVEPGELPPGAMLNMELSALAFNRRVLELARSPGTPLLERFRFLSIFGANLDEFFRVRMAGFKRQVEVGSTKRTLDGVTPQEQVDAIGVRARALMREAYDLLEGELLPALADHGVALLRPHELERDEREWLAGFYRERLHPVLTPLSAGPGHPFPHIRNLRPALGAVVREPASGLEHFVVVELPGGVPRFVPLPGGSRLVALEDVVREHLGDLYPGMEVRGAYTFRVTRSAELHLRRRRVVDVLRAVEAEVRRRPFRPVVRLEVERAMPAPMREMLLRELRYEARARRTSLGEEDVYVVRPPVDLRGLGELAALPLEGLAYAPAEPEVPVDPERSVFEVLREREVLVHFPYDSFEATVERFLLEAASDPDVASVKLALYRTDRKSRIVEALRRAAAAGKDVVALVELTARFDERRNIRWARYLRAAGIHVIYGLPGRKCHAKVALVARREGDRVRHYGYVGTGNLNASTATAYTDLGLLSADPALGDDLHRFFHTLTGHAAPPEYRRLLTAPHDMRRRFVEMIEREAEHAREGRGGHVQAKVNGLADREVIAALYRASQAGVRIELIVRGICALRPGVPGLSENVRVFSILGRYLEHPRIFRFENGGSPEHYIGSADWRTRNLSRRVEAAVAILDPAHRARLDRILHEQVTSPEAWELGSDGSYYRRPHAAPHAPERPAGESGRLVFTSAPASPGADAPSPPD